MQIISLTPEHEAVYCACLEEWSAEIKEAGDHKARWLKKMRDRGLRVKIALDDRGVVGGMIQYVPIEESFVAGEGLYFVHCIWVHGHKQGRGNFQKKGMGKALLAAAEQDARELGARGMAAWGMAIPVFMRASWFKKHGYKKADSLGMQILLWKPFRNDAAPPRWIREKKKPEPAPGRVAVTALVNGWCPGMNTAFERARRAAAEFGDKVEFMAVDTIDRAVFREWGESDAIFVDGQALRMGPPPSYDKIRKAIAKRVKKLPVALLAAFLLGLSVTAGAAETGTAGYGYLVQGGPPCAVWWAEGAYKVLRDDPVPAAAQGIVRIAAARNEYEPFLIVLRPSARLDAVRITAGALANDKGATIGAANVSVRHVGYVKVTTPTDALGRAGWWPDPLPPYQGPFEAAAGENHPLWITVRVPRDAAPGLYHGEVSLSAEGWSCRVPVELGVRTFALPDRSSVRSSFGLPTGDIKAYHNLETREELERVVDLYYQDMREHRVAPTSPFELYPMKVSPRGVFWKGGEFVAEGVHAGRRALKVTDDTVEKNAAATYDALVPLGGSTPLELTLWARTAAAGQRYTVLCEFFTAEGTWIAGANLLRVFEGSIDWKRESVEFPRLPEEASSLKLSLFPAFRDNAGTTLGTAWFDDLVLRAAPKGPGAPIENLLSGGDFEMPLEGMKITIDFSEFDRGARRFLDELGFNAYNLPLEGLGTGSFYSREEGTFCGFPQGTPEYDTLISQYLKQVEEHLAANGWLGREYIYWFDEPDPKDYPFVREGMLNIRKNAPRLTRFITEHRPGPEIMDVSEIGCTIFDRVDPKAVAELAPKGREFWSYLCTGPKGPWVTLFIDHPAINMRMWLWMTFKWGLEGILVWRADYWNSPTLFPPDVLQDPWADPMSYTVGYGVPYGQVNHWGNGDGRFLYPPNRDPGKDRTKYLCGPVDSVRWEILREGIEDYEYFVLLREAAAAAKGKSKLKAAAAEAAKLLDLPATLFTTGKDYTKDPLELLRHRAKVAEAIEKLTVR